MLVRFSSTKTESITMFGDVAQRLIRMLGATGNVPGGISAEDLPQALDHMRAELKTQAQVQPVEVEGENDSNEDSDKQPAVGLKARALPLVDMLERAARAHVPVMWEKM